MLVQDSLSIERAVAQAKRDKHFEDLKQWQEDQVRDSLYVDTMEPHRTLKQLGKPLSTEQFKTKIKTLLPTCRFEYNSFSQPEPIFGNYKTVLVLDLPQGKQYRLPMEQGLIPEFSVMKVKEERVWDPSQTHIDRKDMPKSEWVDNETGFKFDETAPRPGWRNVNKAWGEAVRGWRTVLLRLVKDGFLTPVQVERAFGSADRLTWASHLGKTHELSPW